MDETKEGELKHFFSTIFSSFSLSFSLLVLCKDYVSELAEFPERNSNLSLSIISRMYGRIYTIKYAITKKSSQMVYTTRDGILWTSATRFLIHIKNAEIRAYPIIAIENILFTNLNQLRVFSISKTASLEMETPPPLAIW